MKLFYQALSEIGFYTYDIKPFKALITQIKEPDFGFTLKDKFDTAYNYQIMRNVNKFLQNNGNNILYIYGENDPWSATSFELMQGKTNALKMVKKNGNHKTRISSFSTTEQKQIQTTLEEWLKTEME